MTERMFRIHRHNYKRVFSIICFILVLALTFILQYNIQKQEFAEAYSLANFDPGFIISDYSMGDYDSMTEAEIQAFLTKKNSCSNTNREYYDYLSQNSKYKWHWKDDHFVCLSEELFGDGEVIGEGETAARIIWQAAQDYKINPKVLIVLLEKETSLITDRIPNDGDYRKATGYGCPDTAACSEKYFGFKNQIRNAANLFHIVLTGGWTNFPLGKNYIQYNPNKDCGGSEVNIKNLATSALYRYTPYQPNQGAIDAGYGTTYCGAYGNRNFYLYYGDWFGDPTSEGIIKPPRNIGAVLENNTIKITWEAPEDAEFFSNVKYEVVLADSKKQEIKATVENGKLQYVFKGLSNGIYIATSVKAITKSGSNYERKTFEITIGKKPETLKNTTVSLTGEGVKVEWEKPAKTADVPEIMSYEVAIEDAKGNKYSTKAKGSENKVIFNNLPLSKYIKVTIKAINEIGESVTSTVIDFQNYALLSEEYEIYEGFTDMPKDDISKKAVSWAVTNGITDKNKEFNGENPLTRRQAMVLLWRIMGKQEVANYEGFTDMPKDDISKKAVSWAVTNGITDKNKEFNGENPLTRRQAMVLLWRIMGKQEVANYEGFTDMPKDDISKKAVSWAVTNGITDKNKEFNGENPLTRRQVMVLLWRLYGIINNRDK